MKPNKSPWCCALDVPRWWSVHGPRLDGLGRNPFAGCQGYEPFAQATFISSAANNHSARTSASLEHPGKWQFALNMHNRRAKFPESPARTNVEDANFSARHTMDLICNTTNVALNSSRSFIGNARRSVAVVSAGDTQPDDFNGVLGARGTPLRNHGFINRRLVSTTLTSGGMWGSAESDVRPIKHVLYATPHFANEQPSELPEEKEQTGNPDAQKSQVSGYQQLPSVAFESGVGTDDAF